ncbi:TMEM14 family [Dillenia turbinata]|uniref:TMEM14 family n=1 Tax=Dillenia turbinata TaxID=194707 RepID=A0AAN8W8F2_9MAGN
MSTTLEFFTLPNPNYNLNSLWNRGSSSLMALCLSSPTTSLRFESLLLRPQSKTKRVSVVAPCVTPRGLGSCFLSINRRRRSLSNLPFVPSAASEESVGWLAVRVFFQQFSMMGTLHGYFYDLFTELERYHSEIEVENKDAKPGSDESEEAWKQTLATLKEQVAKMQSVSLEAFDLYSAKAAVILKEASEQLKNHTDRTVVILKEASEQLKVQAEKTRQDLSIIAKEINEEGKEYLSTAAMNSPEPVKEVLEAFASSSDELNDMSKVHDFYLGIPYGTLLSVGGFLSFMVTGSIAALRFGVILGGTLLALSLSSLKSWKKGESSALALKGQAAIASILCLREMHLLFQRPSFFSCLTTLISGAVAAFYIYRIVLDGERGKGLKSEPGVQN